MTKWHGGKGSTPRKRKVSKKQFEDNWDRIFGDKNDKTTESSSSSK
jgi:hypothetical protein